MLDTFFVCLCVVLWKKQIVKTEYRQLVSALLGLFLVESGWLELVSKHGSSARKIPILLFVSMVYSRSCFILQYVRYYTACCCVSFPATTLGRNLTIKPMGSHQSRR